MEDLKSKLKTLESLKDILQTQQKLYDVIIDTKLPGDKHKPKALTIKQIQFIDEYMVDGNGTRAAEVAGYQSPTSQASRMLVMSNVQDEIKRRQKELEKKKGYNREYFITKLEELIADCYNDEVPDRKSILKAYDMIIKMVGYYSPDTLVQVNNNQNHFTFEIINPR